MNNKLQFAQLVKEVDFRLAHRRHLRRRGVHLIVTHGLHVPGTLCAPGEIIEDIALGGEPRPRSLGLSHLSLLLMDCFCRYRRPLTALRIEQIMNTDPFYVRYAANWIGIGQCIARPDRRSVRTYIRKIWKQMEGPFQAAGLSIDPRQILLSEMTESNIVVYRLKATVEVVHITRDNFSRRSNQPKDINR